MRIGDLQVSINVNSLIYLKVLRYHNNIICRSFKNRTPASPYGV